MKRRAPCVFAGFALVLLAVFLVSPAAAIEEADRLWLVGERAFADGLYPAAGRANARRHEEGRRGARAARRLPDEVSGLAARGRRAVLERLDQEHRQRSAWRGRRPARLPCRVPKPRAGGQRAAAHRASPRALRRPRRAA